VLPSNIEKDLMTHPAVEDVAVVGLPHELHRELPVAFIVLKQGKSATAEELIKFVEGKFSSTSRIFSEVVFWGTVPSNLFSLKRKWDIKTEGSGYVGFGLKFWIGTD
jgi:acyl-coenzyme A synthetase/AMP-(fatty) acid ligase